MKSFPWAKTAIVLIFFLIFWMYFSGISSVPFHPDESTQIYMSADSGQPPSTLEYTPASATDGRMRYRLLDAPLTHTLIGWGLMIQEKQPLQTDWNWSQTWEENKAAGALPANETLLAARWSVAWLFPLTCLFLFLAARKIDGPGTAFLATLLTAVNVLVLIHTRRAMAESAMVCALCAALWWMTQNSWKLWLSAIPLGLAINAKQTTLPLTLLGFLQIVFHRETAGWFSRVKRILGFLGILVTITWILNPVFWNSPIEAVKTGLALREDLSARMREDYHSTTNPVEQTAHLISQTFFQQPATADVANYLSATKTQTEEYLAQPYHVFLRGFSCGTILIILTLVGLTILARRTLKNKGPVQYPVAIYLIFTLVCVVTIILFTPVPFQRYYTLLVPLFSIAQATALTELGTILVKRCKKGLSKL